MMEQKSGKKRYLYAMILCLLLLGISPAAKAQFYGIRANTLGWATGNLNIEGSMTISHNWTLHLPIMYNPWTFSGNKKLKHMTITPGARYWLKDSEGHGWFFGMHAIISRYNGGGLLGLKYRYDGEAYGGGLSAGYSLPLYRRWNLEFELGAGAVYYDEDKYECQTCGDKIESRNGLRFVPSKVAVNFVYLF